MLLLSDRSLRAGRGVDGGMEAWKIAQMEGRDGLCGILSARSRRLRRGRTSGGWHGRGHDRGVKVRAVGAHAWSRLVVVVKIVGVMVMMMMMMMMMMIMMMMTTVRATVTTVRVEVFDVFMRRRFSLRRRRLIGLLRCEIITFFETAGQWGDGEVRSRNRFWDGDGSGRGA